MFLIINLQPRRSIVNPAPASIARDYGDRFPPRIVGVGWEGVGGKGVGRYVELEVGAVEIGGGSDGRGEDGVCCAGAGVPCFNYLVVR
jgi:hypothetical protein